MKLSLDYNTRKLGGTEAIGTVNAISLRVRMPGLATKQFETTSYKIKIKVFRIFDNLRC